jgi:hypothetical protein
MKRGADRDIHGCTGSLSRPWLLIAVLVLAGVAASAAGVDAASLSVTWNAPTTKANGTALTDLAGYRVYLGPTQPTCPGASSLSVASPTTQPQAGQTVTHRATGLTAGVTYFVRVTAVDASGNESACSASASGVAQPDFSVSPTATTNFGSVTTGSAVDRTFTVQNTSTASISGATGVGAPFSIASGGSFSLSPGASHTVTVRFRPTSTGSFASNVNFTASGDTVSRGVSGSATGGTSVTLSVTKNGTGSGTVTSSPAGITCGNDCTEAVASGTLMTLTATAASGSVFAGWSGACSGTTACAVSVNAATTATATFNSSTSTLAPAVSSPAAPASPSVTQIAADASGVTFAVTWGAVSGAASYRYAAAFNDGSAGQQGSVTAPSLQLRMAYHSSGAAAGGFVCIRSVNAAGQQSTDQSCNAVPVPARPAATPSAPAPVASSLSPTSAQAGGAGLTLTVNGSRFVSSSVVRWNGAARRTTFVSATRLRATISVADLATVGPVPVSVVTPAPGGGTSGAVSFTITAPVPVVSSLSPATAVAGGTALTLTVNGSRFVPASVVRWNGAARPTTFVSANQLRAAITAADLATARSTAVTVASPAPGGGTSGKVTFTITAPPATPAQPPASSAVPSAPGNPTVRQLTADAGGVTFAIAWSAGSGAASYRYVAAFNDGSAQQQGTVTGLLSFQLRMPYHVSGAAANGFVCIRSVNAAGQQSVDQSCNAVPVPARSR